MRHSTDIAIQRTIVHMVSPSKNHPVLSQRALPQGRMAALHEFFSKHIENSLRDEDCQAARFVTDADSPVVLSCLESIFGTREQFTSATQDVASHLHSIVLQDKRISPGALVCCTYQAQSPGIPDTQFLALLKLDPTEGYQPFETKDSSGRTYITLRTLEDIVPTARERLQKCAFIRTRKKSRKYDLLALDRQGRAREGLAAFFLHKFLAAALVADPASNTRDFWLGAWGGLSAIEKDIGPQKAQLIRKAMQAAVHSPRIDIDNWITTLPIKKGHQERILSSLTARLDDRSITTDVAVAEDLTRKTIFKGERNFRLSFDAAYEDEILKTPPKLIRDPKHGDVYEMTLRIRGLTTSR